MQFQSLEDAQRYLQSSIVRVPYLGVQTYVFIHEVSNRQRVPSINVQPIGATEQTWLSLDDIRIESQPIKLGNMNIDGAVVYCTRMPVRRTQMGLTQESLHMVEITHDRGRHRPEFYNLIATDYLKNMLLENYPTVAESLASRSARAFCRDFAVNPIALTARHLHYKGEIVGEFGNGRFTVYEPVAYVADILRRALALKGETYEISTAS